MGLSPKAPNLPTARVIQIFKLSNKKARIEAAPKGSLWHLKTTFLEGLKLRVRNRSKHLKVVVAIRKVQKGPDLKEHQVGVLFSQTLMR